MQFKDLFSRQSTDYAKFRPTYPRALVSHLVTLVKQHACAWDCGTGNGQAAVLLAEHFPRVIATDPSDKQLMSTIAHPHVEYRRATAEQSGLATGSIDFIAVAQAFHWFDPVKFAAESRRVARQDAVLAIWCYELARITPAVDAIILKLYRDILGGYWEKERRLVEEGYRNVSLPFQEITLPPFTMAAEWSLEHVVGYLKTWSARQSYLAKTGREPLDEIGDDLVQAWGDAAMRPIRWEMGTRAWRL